MFKIDIFLENTDCGITKKKTFISVTDVSKMKREFVWHKLRLEFFTEWLWSIPHA